MKLFQYAIIHDPKKHDKKCKESAVLVKDITSILAEDEKSALIMAAREIPSEYLNRLGEVDIVISPF
jgi:hypothetical protein